MRYRLLVIGYGKRVTVKDSKGRDVYKRFSVAERAWYEACDKYSNADVVYIVVEKAIN